ncbi:MAG: hypothetical protein VKK59_00075 [Vampirovibrionales bacterium]|nr:hypothetical protein [Vampirovibrionales bacterium]
MCRHTQEFYRKKCYQKCRNSLIKLSFIKWLGIFWALIFGLSSPGLAEPNPTSTEALPALSTLIDTERSEQTAPFNEKSQVKTATNHGLQRAAKTTGNVIRSTPTYLRKSLQYFSSPADQNMTLAAEPVRGVVVIGINRHQNDRAFSNISLLAGQTLARQIKQNIPTAMIINPMQVLQEVELADQQARYNLFLKEYLKTGSPDPASVSALLASWSYISNQPIDRLIIVEAQVSLNTPAESHRLGDKIRHFLTDDIPTEVQYPLWIRTDVYDCSHWPQSLSKNTMGHYGESNRIWSDETTVTITARHDVVATPSIFQDSQNVLLFEKEVDKAYHQRLALAPIQVTHHPVNASLNAATNHALQQAKPQVSEQAPLAIKASQRPLSQNQQAVKQGLSTKAKRMPLSGMEPF